MMSRADHLVLGDHNAICFECGMKRKASMMKKHWQGYYVCPEHWESRHPQDYVRNVQDNPTVPWSQPVPADQFRTVCAPNDLTAIPRRAIPGCVKPAYVSPFFDPAMPFLD